MEFGVPGGERGRELCVLGYPEDPRLLCVGAWGGQEAGVIPKVQSLNSVPIQIMRTES